MHYFSAFLISLYFNYYMDDSTDMRLEKFIELISILTFITNKNFEICPNPLKVILLKDKFKILTLLREHNSRMMET
ncbi:hypothetical protein PCOAH_00051150 [Plasmodium coatneyi]|uniref:Uncharacterized protein n=1 Tax=Plasmodium coatneyi TaxID=208452 RepID=A0A1B1E6I8_9APIC|nr:hypothetical protein PCOAH_00051150 [Plasmodium coatneyi]ANQ10560.1 hypothetical protein PCOAH_00051150 [Plasmodium coatneyi]